MTVGAAMEKAAIRLVGYRPSSFFSSNDQLAVELCDLVNEVAQDIVASHEWQGLTRIHEIVPDGGTSYPRPADYGRMLVGTEIDHSHAPLWGYYHAATMGEFVAMRERNWPNYPGVWALFEDRFNFAPAPTGVGIFPYISKNYAIASGSGDKKPEFTADSDTFVLPERLLTLGLVWRWRENKKLDFTGDQEAFMKAISEESGKDKGSRPIFKRRSSRIAGIYRAWDGTLGGF